ncbi:MAG: copper resistance protein NlpE N-terminal domain-containing protein [Robiginitalea sp.]|nr:copper resistance protein NlpE N-terminal domain-containing protein [Robiginitalea sp.]
MKTSSIKFAFIAALLVVGTAGCKPKKGSKPAEEAAEPTEAVSTSFQDEHNSRNSLDWNGTYQGTLPCADCEGIKTRLTLTESGEFDRMVHYLGKEETGRWDSGTFQWNEAGSQITLNPLEGEPQSYQVGENRLFHLDREGKRITGDLAEKYELVKNRADYQLENKKWILTEIMGKEFTPGEGNNEAYLYFDRETGRVSGNNSCNSINGTYDLQEGNRISFSRMASTLMACPDMQTADLFNEVLERADNYTVADGILSLNKARMAPMARFRQE